MALFAKDIAFSFLATLFRDIIIFKERRGQKWHLEIIF